MAFEPKRIFLHHSLTKDTTTVSWGAIRRYHTEVKKWSAIGYHAGVELVRSGNHLNFEVLFGRMWNRQGAHCRGQNEDSLSLCFVGNFDNHKVPDGQLEAGGRIISLWMQLYGIKLKDIYGHTEFDSTKTCPGKLFSLDDLKHYIF